MTEARFESLLAALGLDYCITWRWVGRCRHGVIEVFDVGLGATDGVVMSEEFNRNTYRWRENERRLGRMRTNSPKHNAVKVLIARLHDLFE